MPGVDRECTTHHYACDCREAKFAALEVENEQLTVAFESLRQSLTQMQPNYEQAKAALKEVITTGQVPAEGIPKDVFDELDSANREK